MGLGEIKSWEKRNMERLQRFQLPNRWKSIGVVLVFAIIGTIIGLKFTEIEPLWMKEMLRNGLLISLLIISLSKEKIEDEYIGVMRSQSYRMGFIVGVCYAIIQPYVNFGVALLIRPDHATTDMSYFQVLTFMLLIQLMFFHVSLKICNT